MPSFLPSAAEVAAAEASLLGERLGDRPPGWEPELLRPPAPSLPLSWVSALVSALLSPEVEDEVGSVIAADKRSIRTPDQNRLTHKDRSTGAQKHRNSVENGRQQAEAADNKTGSGRARTDVDSGELFHDALHFSKGRPPDRSRNTDTMSKSKA